MADKNKISDSCDELNKVQTKSRAFLLKRYNFMFESQKYVDLEIVCEKGKTIKAHRFILATFSAWWKKIFSDEKFNGTVRVNYDKRIIELVLRYCYVRSFKLTTHVTESLTPAENYQLLKAGYEFQIPCLVNYHVNKLLDASEEEIINWMLNASFDFNINALRLDILGKVYFHFVRMIKHTSCVDLNVEALRSLLTLDRVMVLCDGYETIATVKNWAEQKILQECPPPHGAQTTAKQYLERCGLFDLVKFDRMKKMSYFCMSPDRYAGLLTREEFENLKPIYNNDNMNFRVDFYPDQITDYHVTFEGDVVNDKHQLYNVKLKGLKKINVAVMAARGKKEKDLLYDESLDITMYLNGKNKTVVQFRQTVRYFTPMIVSFSLEGMTFEDEALENLDFHVKFNKAGEYSLFSKRRTVIETYGKRFFQLTGGVVFQVAFHYNHIAAADP